ncbi:MAG TPA: hypothetical protein VK796_13100 [Cytophaga sp.]|jgi:hypothetical protein|nr:hypothetical protein [Cytophaga sp.]
MKFINITFLAWILACMSFSNRIAVDGCSILHSGTFEYIADKDKVKVVIDGENHTEYHKGGKYVMESKLVWVNECEYNATLAKVTIPDCPFPVGTVMNVKINKVEGKTIFYTATIKGQSFPGELKKIK